VNAVATLPIVNIAAYKFVPLADLPARRKELKQLCGRLALRGTILLSPEGINLFVAGSRESIDELLNHLRADAALADLEVKESLSEYQPFNRMLVRLKREIIAFGVEGIEPARHPSPKLTPRELKQWLDEGREVVLLDTRNDYEVDLGTFAGAEKLNIGHFREFPQAVKQLPGEMKEKPVVMFCTGGIRCEKAGPLMQREGFRNIFQLEGGILKYFEECGGEHYDGECFVFDQRVAVDATLRETDTKQCFACQSPLTREDQQSERFVPGESCPHCYREEAVRGREAAARRQQKLNGHFQVLPGSVAYDNERPINVPQRLEGVTLAEFLTAMHPHIGRGEWEAKCAAGRIAYQGIPARAARIVKAGERYVHLLPATVEPEVAGRIRILYEDDCLVAVHKPAPLPMHPCGRFNRNTLIYLLNEVYHPQKLRPLHRLDANTSGVVVLARTKAIAREVQPQFERREVEKVYLARVAGCPPDDAFECHLPISATPSEIGIRLPDPAGQQALTRFRVVERYDDTTTLLEAYPITGRTNQIRLHLWQLGMPVCGDPSYLPHQKIGAVQTLTPSDPPLCLHAWRLELHHPASGETLEFTAEPPEWRL